MNWEIGKEYPTRQGGIAIIHSIREGQDHPLIGECYTHTEEKWYPQSWILDGGSVSSMYEDEFDIIIDKKPIEEKDIHIEAILDDLLGKRLAVMQSQLNRIELQLKKIIQ